MDKKHFTPGPEPGVFHALSIDNINRLCYN